MTGSWEGATWSPTLRTGLTHCGRLGIFVVDGYREQGVGRRLMEAVLAAAWDLGLTRIELDVFSDNLRAIRLYESLGFEHEGRRRRARVLDGITQDFLVMAALR